MSFRKRLNFTIQSILLNSEGKTLVLEALLREGDALKLVVVYVSKNGITE